LNHAICGHTILPPDWKSFYNFADRHHKAALDQER